MHKKIVIVSSGQPSANPRLVKEAIALSSLGYDITVIYCPLSEWADEYDATLFKENGSINWVKAGYHLSKEKWLYNYARLRKKYWHLVYKVFGNKYDAAIRSSVLYSQELNAEVKKHKADIYIGHNLGAIPAIVIAAKHNKSKALFDFEDFHRGEGKDNEDAWIKTLQTEDKYIPFLYSATAASPLINAAYKNLYPTLIIETINNCFPLKYAVSEIKLLPTQPLKLFWFSQTIGKNRGLETVIQAMAKIKNIEVTLLGNYTNSIKNYFLKYAEAYKVDPIYLHFLLPVDESEITAIAARHHIGLSTEVPITINRDVCLTNKLFMYLLAGNAIIFSRTTANISLVKEHTEIGKLFTWDNPDELADIFKYYQNDHEALNTHRANALYLGTKIYNWDIEKSKFLTYVENV